ATMFGVVACYASHHANDQGYKEALIRFNSEHCIFIDGSVDTREISDTLTDEQIRIAIRDYYLADSTVTILLVGTATKNRKHVDWEIYSSMKPGRRLNGQCSLPSLGLQRTSSRRR